MTGHWLIAGTPVGQPYPCRCHERRGPKCSAAWCPCAGRFDPPNRQCCGNWFTGADHKRAMTEWRVAKLARERAERGESEA